MTMTSKLYKSSCLLALIAAPAWTGLSAQQQDTLELQYASRQLLLYSFDVMVM